MAVVSAYLLMRRVVVTSGGCGFYGIHSFGLSLLPFLIGAGVLTYGLGLMARALRPM